MKKIIIVLALVLTLVIGIGATAYAATNGSQTAPQRLGLGRITSMRGYDSMISVLKNKLGLTDTDINNARSSGKTLYELAEEKGLTAEQLKTALYDERVKAIDDAVNKGTITKEQGDTLKENLKSNIDNCTGTFGQGQGAGRGRGMMGNGQRGAGCPYYNTTK
jgi:ribosomal protein S20